MDSWVSIIPPDEGVPVNRVAPGSGDLFLAFFPYCHRFDFGGFGCVTEYRLDRADFEDRAFLASGDDGDGTDCHGFLLN